MDIGVAAAGFEIAVSCEHDPSCCQTLRRNKALMEQVFD